MTISDDGLSQYASDPSSRPSWGRVLLGLVMLVAGFLILGDVALFTVVSTILIGWLSIAAGAFEVVTAFWNKKWTGSLWQILLGALYIAFGVTLVTRPLVGALVLTYALGIMLVISGFVRIFLGIKHWRQIGWVFLVSGLFGILAGLVILTGFPRSGMWVLGFVFAFDLIIHGVAWLTYGWWSPRRIA
jgi:uncharacterized membrane protein HdeD (DUF308 family)